MALNKNEQKWHSKMFCMNIGALKFIDPISNDIVDYCDLLYHNTSVNSPGYMKGWPPHQPLMSIMKYMTPSRRNEKQPMQITYDRDLWAYNHKHSAVWVIVKLVHEGLQASTDLAMDWVRQCETKYKQHWAAVCINNTEYCCCWPTVGYGTVVWCISISSGSLARAPWSCASESCPCLFLSARMFDVISSNVKWLHPRTLQQASFI